MRRVARPVSHAAPERSGALDQNHAIVGVLDGAKSQQRSAEPPAYDQDIAWAQIRVRHRHPINTQL
jgi:hypothetical protein